MNAKIMALGALAWVAGAVLAQSPGAAPAPASRWGTPISPAPAGSAVPDGPMSSAPPNAQPSSQPNAQPVTDMRSPASVAPGRSAAAMPRSGGAGTALRWPEPARLPLAGAALAQANQQLLAQITPLREATPSPAAPVPTRQAADETRHWGAGARAAPAAALSVDPSVVSSGCTNKGSIAKPVGKLTPEGLVMLRGCDLGFAKGQVRMQGAFPNGYVLLKVHTWRSDLVVAEVPGDVQGVLDQSVKLAVARSDGRLSNEVPGQFQARRVVLPIPSELVRVVNCARPQPSLCEAHTDSRGVAMLFAQHSGDDSQAGTDIWNFVLGNHWQMERVETDLAVGEVTVLRAGVGAGVEVRWRSLLWDKSEILFSSDLFAAGYRLQAFAIGPAGVPFTGSAN